MSAASKVGGGLAPKRGAGGLKIMSDAARNEHAFIGQLLLQLIGPRFTTEASFQTYILFSLCCRQYKARCVKIVFYCVSSAIADSELCVVLGYLSE